MVCIVTIRYYKMIIVVVLGAKFGYSSIPKYYIDNLSDKEMYHNKITAFIDHIIRAKMQNMES